MQHFLKTLKPLSARTAAHCVWFLLWAAAWLCLVPATSLASRLNTFEKTERAAQEQLHNSNIHSALSILRTYWEQNIGLIGAQSKPEQDKERRARLLLLAAQAYESAGNRDAQRTCLCQARQAMPDQPQDIKTISEARTWKRVVLGLSQSMAPFSHCLARKIIVEFLGPFQSELPGFEHHDEYLDIMLRLQNQPIMANEKLSPGEIQNLYSHIRNTSLYQSRSSYMIPLYHDMIQHILRNTDDNVLYSDILEDLDFVSRNFNDWYQQHPCMRADLMSYRAIASFHRLAAVSETEIDAALAEEILTHFREALSTPHCPGHTAPQHLFYLLSRVLHRQGRPAPALAAAVKAVSLIDADYAAMTPVHPFDLSQQALAPDVYQHLVLLLKEQDFPDDAWFVADKWNSRPLNRLLSHGLPPAAHGTKPQAQCQQFIKAISASHQLPQNVDAPAWQLACNAVNSGACPVFETGGDALPHAPALQNYAAAFDSILELPDNANALTMNAIWESFGEKALEEKRAFFDELAYLHKNEKTSVIEFMELTREPDSLLVFSGTAPDSVQAQFRQAPPALIGKSIQMLEQQETGLCANVLAYIADLLGITEIHSHLPPSQTIMIAGQGKILVEIPFHALVVNSRVNQSGSSWLGKCMSWPGELAPRNSSPDSPSMPSKCGALNPRFTTPLFLMDQHPIYYNPSVAVEHALRTRNPSPTRDKNLTDPGSRSLIAIGEEQITALAPLAKYSFLSANQSYFIAENIQIHPMSRIKPFNNPAFAKAVANPHVSIIALLLHSQAPTQTTAAAQPELANPNLGVSFSNAQNLRSALSSSKTAGITAADFYCDPAYTDLSLVLNSSCSNILLEDDRPELLNNIFFLKGAHSVVGTVFNTRLEEPYGFFEASLLSQIQYGNKCLPGRARTLAQATRAALIDIRDRDDASPRHWMPYKLYGVNQNWSESCHDN